MTVQPTLVTVEGRGESGKTRLQAALGELSAAAGRRPRLLDLDSHTPALSKLYPGDVILPESAEQDDLHEKLKEELGRLVEEGGSLFVDTGGGQDTLTDIARELDLSTYCADVGVRRLRLMVFGPDPQALEHVVAVLPYEIDDESKPGGLRFCIEDVVLCLNLGKVDKSRPVANAFAPIMETPAFHRLRGIGVKAVTIPRLGCMHTLVEKGQSYRQAAQEKGGKGFNAIMVKKWLDQVKASFTEQGIELP